MIDVPEWEPDPDDGDEAEEPEDRGFEFETWLSEATSIRESSGSTPGDAEGADGGFDLSVGVFDFDAWLADARREPEPTGGSEEPAAEADAAEVEGFDFAGWLGDAGAADAVAAVTGRATGAGAGAAEIGDSVESPTLGEVVAVDTPPIKLALFALFAFSALAAGLTVASTARMFHFEGPGGPEQAVVVATSTPSPTATPTASPTAAPTATPTETPHRGTPPAILRTDSPTPSPIPSTATASPTPTASPSPPTTSATPTPTGFIDDGGLFNESSDSGDDGMLFVFPSSLLGLGAVTVLVRRR